MNIMTQSQGLVKKNLTQKQDNFLTALFSNGGNISEALKTAKYSQHSRKDVLASLKEEIAERTKVMLSGAAVKAADNIIKTMDVEVDAEIPTNRLELRYRAAGDVLDRIGITKRQQIDVSGEIKHGIVLLPSKKPMVDVTP
jgi:hypothetical protein|tara:strand:- start:1894 stop:2316 length:423 start_codon:yes stop_codon:yes gene_type:complete